MVRRRLLSSFGLYGLGLVMVAVALVPAPRRASAATALIGSGSSFAGIELQEWSREVGSPPYNLNVNYQSSSSGEGRQNFTDNVVDFAVTDIRYNQFDVRPPAASTFAYVPVTAGGIAFMYNLKSHGFTDSQNIIKLSPLTVCGLFTAAIPFWDDPAIAADNPGVQLPHVTVTPVVRSDPAGTNWVLEEYCIALQPDLYARFANRATQTSGVAYPPDQPTSNWPLISPVAGAQGSEGAADTVAAVNSDGYVTAVETGYALQRHFPVASVKNDTGGYVPPAPDNVAAALSFAQQRSDGTHVLNFAPGSASAYNPSTYSYMLVRLTAAQDKGAAITSFAEYCLTFGQAGAAQLGYASIGRNLINFGLNRLKDVPGYVPPSADELAQVPGSQQAPPGSSNSGSSSAAAGSSAGGSSTSSGSSSRSSGGNGSVALSGGSGGSGVALSGGSGAALSGGSGAGLPATGPTAGGVTGAGSTSPGSLAGTAGRSGASAAGGTLGANGARLAASSRTGARAGTGAGAASSALGVDPSASLGNPVGPLGQTGVESDILAGVGVGLLAVGEAARRWSRRSWESG